MTRTLTPDNILVAFSFAGEQRQLVRDMAVAVEARLGSGTVFLDEWYEPYLLGGEADLKFQTVFGTAAKLIVVCISGDYGEKPWTLQEHAAIRDLDMRMRVSNHPPDKFRICPVRVGDGDIPGLLSTTILADIRGRSATDAAQLIVQRLQLAAPELLIAEPTCKVLFLAEGTADVEEQRERLKLFIEAQGWSVLPESEYSETDSEKRLADDLRRSSAFVQILGAYPWRIGRFDRRQNEAAEALGLPRFRFRSTEIDLRAVEERSKPHHDFITAGDVIKSGYTDFRVHLSRELKKIHSRLRQLNSRPLGTERQRLIRVVIRSTDPDPLWDSIFRWIYDDNQMRPSQIEAGGSLVEEEASEASQGLLVVCDGSAAELAEHSPKTILDEYRQIQLRAKEDQQRQPVGILYWPPPEVSGKTWSRLLRNVPPKLYRMVGGGRQPPPEWTDFIDAVRQVVM